MKFLEVINLALRHILPKDWKLILSLALAYSEFGFENGAPTLNAIFIIEPSSSKQGEVQIIASLFF